jgi:hypothetical protein
MRMHIHVFFLYTHTHIIYTQIQQQPDNLQSQFGLAQVSLHYKRTEKARTCLEAVFANKQHQVCMCMCMFMCVLPLPMVMSYCACVSVFPSISICFELFGVPHSPTRMSLCDLDTSHTHTPQANFDVLRLLGSVYYQLHELEKGYALLKQASELSPMDLEVLIDLVRSE